MSDYVHEKVVRLPFPNELKNVCNTNDVYDCESYLSEKLGDLYCDNNKNSFKLGYTENGYYIDWLYYHTYGEESDDWGIVRKLTRKELKVITPYFDKLGVDYKHSDLRIVDYCYYNCCEPPDYYEIKNHDDSDLFIN